MSGHLVVSSGMQEMFANVHFIALMCSCAANGNVDFALTQRLKRNYGVLKILFYNVSEKFY